MIGVPCRVMADLRRHEAEQDAAEVAWEIAHARRKEDAAEEVLDGTILKQHLDDEDLAHPLAEVMRDLETGADLTKSVTKLRTRLIEILVGE